MHLVDKAIDTCVKIATDAYFKRYVIERYKKGIYQETLYDSALLDFRKLDPKIQLGWQKASIQISSEKQVHRLLDLEERTLLLETSFFKEGLCVLTKSHHPQGTLLCENHLFYKQFGSILNCAILLDRIGKPVVIKEYEQDSCGEFSTLLYENWECKKETVPVRFQNLVGF